MQLVWILLPLVASVNADCDFMGKKFKDGESTPFVNFIYSCEEGTMKLTHCLMTDKVTKVALGTSLVKGNTRTTCVSEDGKTKLTETTQSEWLSKNNLCEEGKPVGFTWSDAKYSYICEKVADVPTKTITACVMEESVTLKIGDTKTVANKKFECKKHASREVELILAVVAEPTTTTSTKKPGEPPANPPTPKCIKDNKEFAEGEEYIPKFPAVNVFTCIKGSMNETACALNGKKLSLGELRIGNGFNYTCIIKDGKIIRTDIRLPDGKCEGDKMIGESWNEGDLTKQCTPELKIVITACIINGSPELPVGEKKEINRKNYECKKFDNGTVVLLSTEIMDGLTKCVVGNSFREQNKTWNDDYLNYICTFNNDKKMPEVITLGCNKKNEKTQEREVILIGEKKTIDSVTYECVKFPNGTITLVTEFKGCLWKEDKKELDQTWPEFTTEYGFRWQCFAGGLAQVIECVHGPSMEFIKVGVSKQYDTELFECKKFSNGTVWLVKTDLSCKDDKGTVRKPGERWEIQETRVTWECKNGKQVVVFCSYDHFGTVKTIPYMGRYRVLEKEKRCEEKGMMAVDAKLA